MRADSYGCSGYFLLDTLYLGEGPFASGNEIFQDALSGWGATLCRR